MTRKIECLIIILALALIASAPFVFVLFEDHQTIVPQQFAELTTNIMCLFAFVCFSIAVIAMLVAAIFHAREVWGILNKEDAFNVSHDES